MASGIYAETVSAKTGEWFIEPKTIFKGYKEGVGYEPTYKIFDKPSEYAKYLTREGKINFGFAKWMISKKESPLGVYFTERIKVRGLDRYKVGESGEGYISQFKGTKRLFVDKPTIIIEKTTPRTAFGVFSKTFGKPLIKAIIKKPEKTVKYISKFIKSEYSPFKKKFWFGEGYAKGSIFEYTKEAVIKHELKHYVMPPKEYIEAGWKRWSKKRGLAIEEDTTLRTKTEPYFEEFTGMQKVKRLEPVFDYYPARKITQYKAFGLGDVFELSREGRFISKEIPVKMKSKYIVSEKPLKEFSGEFEMFKGLKEEGKGAIKTIEKPKTSYMPDIQKLSEVGKIAALESIKAEKIKVSAYPETILQPRTEYAPQKYKQREQEMIYDIRKIGLPLAITKVAVKEKLMPVKKLFGGLTIAKQSFEPLVIEKQFAVSSEKYGLKQALRQKTGLREAQMFQMPPIITTTFTGAGFIPFAMPFKLKPSDFGLGKTVSYKTKPKYKPSLLGIEYFKEFGTKIKKAPKLVTGFGIRPVVSMRSIARAKAKLKKKKK